MSNKETTARIEINKLLEAADLRFFAGGKPAEGDDASALLPVNMKFESFMPALLDKIFRGGFR